MSQKFRAMSWYLPLARLLPHPDAGDDLRNGHVRLQPGQHVLAVGQRIQDLRVVETLRCGQVAFGAGDRVQVGQGFWHPAEFGAEDHLHVRVGQPRRAPVHPVGQLHGHVERLVIARQLVLVDQAGQVLVDHVVRRPDRLALLQPVEVDLGERRQVAGVETRLRRFGLQRGELADQVAAAGPGRVVAGVGVGQGEAGHQVPGGVTADLGCWFFPAADGLSCRRLAVVPAEGTQHAFGIKEEQVAGVPGLVVLERAGEQVHAVQRERGGAARRAIGCVAAGHWRGAGCRRSAGALAWAVGVAGMPSATSACSATRAPMPTPSAVSAWRLLRPPPAFFTL